MEEILDEEMEAMLLGEEEDEKPTVEAHNSSAAYLDIIPLDSLDTEAIENCRLSILPMTIRDIADSIAQNGLIQPVVCAPRPDGKYNLVAGFRRFFAHRLLQKEGRLTSSTIKAVIDPALNDPMKAMLYNLSENLQRKQLNMLEEALAIKKLREAGQSRETISAQIGMSPGWVQERLMLLDLPPEIQQEAAMGFLTSVTLRQIYTLFRRKGKVAAYEACKKAKAAKQKGEKIKLVEKQVSILRQAKRTHAEIIKMKNFIWDNIGANYATVALAWASGNITDFEFFCHIEHMTRASGRGLRYVKPDVDGYNGMDYGRFEPIPTE